MLKWMKGSRKDCGFHHSMLHGMDKKGRQRAFQINMNFKYRNNIFLNQGFSDFCTKKSKKR